MKKLMTTDAPKTTASSACRCYTPDGNHPLEQDLVRTYHRLREQGLSHEQAMAAIRCQHEDVTAHMV